MKIENLPCGDTRYQNLYENLKDQIYILADGLPIPGIIGVIEMIKLDLLREQEQ